MRQDNMNVLVVGLGIIGGSFAAAICEYVPNWQVGGFDLQADVINSCVDYGFIHTAVSESTLDSYIPKADMIILAVPILEIIHFLKAKHPLFKEDAIILDVGSTKSRIIETMNALPAPVQYIGGHPMTGKSTAGVDGISPILFQEKLFILCQSIHTSQATLKTTRELLQAIGNYIIEIEPGRHDFLVAVASHLPYLIPALLVKSADRAEDDLVWQVAAGGFRGIVNNAAHNIPMWEDILFTNNEHIIRSLEIMAKEISSLKDLLVQNDRPSLRQYLEQVNQVKEKL